jgi:hypothetical protein
MLGIDWVCTRRGYQLKEIKVGMVVEVNLAGMKGNLLVVDGVEEEIKNGRPGIHGHCLCDPKDSRWQYLDQIIAIRAKNLRTWNQVGKGRN